MEARTQSLSQMSDPFSPSFQLASPMLPPIPPVAPIRQTSTVPSSTVSSSESAVPYLSWSIGAFTSFLLSADNSPFQDHVLKTWHDMSRPLPEYFISSSHNTYLVGHQFIGDSTIEGYIRALLHGCRSVERETLYPLHHVPHSPAKNKCHWGYPTVDIWDGDDGPVIFHGRTLTTKISLADVVRAIAKYAFVASPYPVIISAEIHCSLEQQDLIADVMKREFADMLLTAAIEGEEVFEALPSPEQLKYRILLKVSVMTVPLSFTVIYVV
jgi:phosphatidylinositol phospholipase C, delta